MPTRVIVPPEPIVAPADVPGSHAANDPIVAGMIAAATAMIDGPFGWVGRSFGPQTLEYTARCWSDVGNLPYGPVISVDSVSYIGSDEADATVDGSNWYQDGDYLGFLSPWSQPALSRRQYPIKIRYQAGYNGTDVEAGGTGDIPENAKAAIIEGVQQMILARDNELGIRSREVNDIETITYMDADKVSAIMRNASSGLLAGLWVPVI
jgi:hypothetical protein